MGLYDEKGKLNAAGQAYNKKHPPQPTEEATPKAASTEEAAPKAASTEETAGPEEPLLAIMDDPEKNESKNTEEPEKEADEPDPKAEAEEAEEAEEEEVEAEVEVGPEPDLKVEPEEEAEEAEEEEEEEDDLKEGGRLSPKAQAEAVFGKPEEKENPRTTLMRELLELFLGLWEQGENYLKPEELEIAIGSEPPEPEPEALQIEAEIEPPEPEPEALQIEAEKEQPKIEDGPPKIKDAQGDLSQAIVEYKNPESDANQDKKDESPNNAVSIRQDSTTPKPS